MANHSLDGSGKKMGPAAAKEGPRERLEQFTTPSGIPLKAVYTEEDLDGAGGSRSLGLPGQPPFTRGIYPNMYRGKLWTIRQFSGFGTPEETNRRFKLEHELGQTGFSIAFDAVTESGLDPDDPRVQGDVGMGGVPVSSLQDMETMFDGLPIDRVSTAVVATPWTACALSAMYFAVAEKRGVPLDKLDGTTQNDLLLFTGCCKLMDIIPPGNMLRLCVDVVEWCAKNTPRWHPVSFASYNYRENAITAPQELGLLFANAIAYIDEELGRGRLKIDDFAPTLSFHLAAHNDILEEVAKFRAARRMWYRLITERYHAGDPRSALFRFHVQTSGSTHTYQQPLNNVVRIAYQTLAAALGGAQSIHACSYDEALCLPTDQSILLSIRTQQIAQLESGVASVADPLGGSYYVESLTNEVEKRSWEYLDTVEKEGGLVATLESGWVHREFQKAMMDHETKLATGKTPVVGVNVHTMEKEPYDVPLFRPNPNAAEHQRARLERLKANRDNSEVASALEEVRERTVRGDNVMPAVMRAVKAYASLGEVQAVWKKLYPLWRMPIGI
ncbi:MAG: methylmalonyl-CoA mutase [Chloroflexi bacterium]|nr:methylmalonyl-CoA mutase [Chloroflexota bacterium]